MEVSRVARVESVDPAVTVSFPDDATAIQIPDSRRADSLVLTVGDQCDDPAGGPPGVRRL